MKGTRDMSGSGKQEENVQGEGTAPSTVATADNSYYSMLSSLLSSGASMASNTFYGLYKKLPTAITGIAYDLPRLAGKTPLGQLRLDIGKDGLLKVLEDLAKVADPAIKMSYCSLGPIGVLVFDPKLITEIRTQHDDKFSRELPIFKILGTPNILTYPNNIWSQARAIFLQEVPKIQKHVPKMEKIANKHLKFLSTDEDINLHDFFVGYVLDVITETLMGLQDNDEPTLNKMKGFFKTLIEEFFNFRGLIKWSLPWPLRYLFFWGENNDLEKFNREIREKFKETFKIDEIKTAESLLMSVATKLFNMSKAENPQKLDSLDDEIFAQCAFLITAGVVTTVATLEFAMKLLSVNPGVEDKLYKELSSALGNKDIEDITLEDIKNIEYLEWFFKEVLRFFPPVPLNPPRELEEEVELSNGVKIQKGHNIFIPAWITHSLEEYWGKDVREFKPERFAPDPDGKERPQGLYIPFGMGEHRCVGDRFAFADMKIIFVKFFLKFRCELINDPPPDPNNKNKFNVTMARGGLSLEKDPIANLFSREEEKKLEMEEEQYGHILR